MALLDMLGMRRTPSGVVRKEMVFGLTPLGTQKAEKFELDGKEFDILATLQERGPSTIEEISDELHLRPIKVKMILKKLMKSDYVKTMKSGDG